MALRARALALVPCLAFGIAGRADAQSSTGSGDGTLSDADALKMAEAQARGQETVEIWDERPEKPFDRDTEVRLTGEELARRGATDLASALQLLPDVTVRDAGRGGFNLDIRGARKGAVRVLIDGVAVSDPYYGTFDVSSIPITDIVEIRVSTAPASPIDGPGGPGGVIEVHTRDAIGPQLTVARGTTDTLPTFGATATGRVPLAKTVALRLSMSSLFGAEVYDTATDATASDHRRASTGAFRVESRVGARRIAVDGFVDDRRYLSPPSDELATSLFLLVDHETTGRMIAALDQDLGADRKLQLQVRGWIHAMSRISRNFRDPALTQETSREQLFSMRAGAAALMTRPIGRHERWVGSLTVDHEDASVYTTAGNATVRTAGNVTVIEAAGDGQTERGPIKADASVGVAVPVGIDAAAWPEAKLTVDYKHRHGNLEVIGARKGRVPSLRERFDGRTANISLAPEQAWDAELRATARPRDGVELVVAPYVRRTTGTVKVGMDNLLVNLGQLDVHGVDVSAKAALGDRASVGAAYEYARASSADLGPDPLDRFPAHRAEAWAQGGPIAHLVLWSRVRYLGSSNDQGNVTPAYELWDATLTGTFRGGWLGVLRADDLLDRAPETRSGYHAPGRVLSLIVQHTWG